MSVTKTKVARVAANRPIPLNLTAPATEPQLKFDMTITKEDLVRMKVDEVREQLAGNKSSAEVAVRAAVDARAKAVTKLEEAARRRIEEASIDDMAKAVVTALTTFTGNQHHAKIVSADSTVQFWYPEKKKKDEEPEVDIKKSAIVGEVRIVVADSRNCETVVVSRKTEIPFNKAMKDAVAEIEQATKAVRKANDELYAVEQTIRDIPNLQSRATNAITAAILRGQITDSAQLLDAVMGTQVKQLPGPRTAGSDDDDE